jgi:formyl-CoA transferase
VSLAVWEAGRYFATGEIPRPQGSAHQSTAPYQAFRAADGFFTAGVPSPKLWTAFLGIVGLEHLADDPRFAANAERLHNRDELARLIEEVTIRRPVMHWLAAFQAAGVPCNPIQDYGQVFSDPHLAARSFFWDGEHPTAGAVRQLGSPMRMSETPTRRDWAGPLLGQHSAEVLAEAGYSSAEIAALREQGVIA